MYKLWSWWAYIQQLKCHVGMNKCKLSNELERHDRMDTWVGKIRFNGFVFQDEVFRLFNLNDCSKREIARERSSKEMKHRERGTIDDGVED